MLWFLTFGTACLLGLVTVLRRWSDAYIDRIKAKTILAADWQPLSAGEIHGDSLGNRFYILVPRLRHHGWKIETWGGTRGGFACRIDDCHHVMARGKSGITSVGETHFTEDGAIHLAAVQQAATLWAAKLWGETLASGSLYESRVVANAQLRQWFREMFPEHRCDDSCFFWKEQGEVPTAPWSF